MRLQGFDSIWIRLLQLYGALTLVFLAVVPRWSLPAEDAVILFQYSRNLALHGAITFVAGGARAEGATDFAWMVLVAGAIKLGIAPYWFCAWVNVLALLALGALLLRMARVRVSLGGVLAVAGAAGLFPQIFAAASGFAVLVDALLLVLLVFCVVERRIAAAALTALAFCLFRPDGVVFALPLLALLLRERDERAATLRRLLWFVVPGAAYFAWRWHYFGELFPLPFLVKSDTPRVLGLWVARSVRESWIFLAFAALVLAALRSRGALRVGVAVGLLGFPTLFYWAMRLDQNVGSRFFYYVPLATAVLLALAWPRLGVAEGGAARSRVLRVAALSWLVLLAMPLYRESRTFRDMQFGSVKAIAEELSAVPGGTILTSEAGFLPYYSGWTTVDAWGLNTPEFAHRFFQAGDVARTAADLVVLHPDRGESCAVQPEWEASYARRTWPHLTRNLVSGAQAAGYELWLTSYGSDFYRRRKGWSYGAGDHECWFVRRSSPRYAAMVAALRRQHGVVAAR